MNKELQCTCSIFASNDEFNKQIKNVNTLFCILVFNISVLFYSALLYLIFKYFLYLTTLICIEMYVDVLGVPHGT